MQDNLCICVCMCVLLGRNRYPGIEDGNGTLLMSLVPFPSDEEMRRVFAAVHNYSGLVVINHYPWDVPRMMELPTRETLVSWGADLIEGKLHLIYPSHTETSQPLRLRLFQSF